MPRFATQQIIRFDRSASRRNLAVQSNGGSLTIEMDASDDFSGDWIVTDTVGLDGGFPMSTVSSRVRFTPLGGCEYYIAAQALEIEGGA